MVARFHIEISVHSLLHCDSYGIKGYRVTSADEFSDILHECLFHSPEGTKLVEVKTLFPCWPVYREILGYSGFFASFNHCLF